MNRILEFVAYAVLGYFYLVLLRGNPGKVMLITAFLAVLFIVGHNKQKNQ